MLGVVKAGAAICVIDESYPVDCVNFIIRDTGSKAVIDYEWMGSHESPHTSIQAHRFLTEAVGFNFIIDSTILRCYTSNI